MKPLLAQIAFDLSSNEEVFTQTCLNSAAPSCFKKTISMLCWRPLKVCQRRFERNPNLPPMRLNSRRMHSVWEKQTFPYLAFNSLQTETHKSEQRGLMNLFVGMFGTFRNVTAHGEKLTWDVTEQDALDLLTLVSMLHRRLDASIRTPRTTE
jgi:hypothetical protein